MFEAALSALGSMVGSSSDAQGAVRAEGGIALVLQHLRPHGGTCVLTAAADCLRHLAKDNVPIEVTDLLQVMTLFSIASLPHIAMWPLDSSRRATV